MTPQGPAPVTVLMALHDGARHLPDQLGSLAAQTGTDWRLIVSDDGSADAGPEIVRHFARSHPVRLVAGPGQGFARNFLSLLALPGEAGAVALADQDDVWFPDKLARALARLAVVPPQIPALYCSARLDWWSATGRRRPSRRLPHPPAFANALIENVAAGNTIVLNPAAAELARQTAELAAAADVPLHDWWLYLLVSGCGGQVIHDPVPSLLYRQHEANLVGADRTGAGLRSKLAVLQGHFAARVERNLQALQAVEMRLTSENRDRLAAFVAARRCRRPRRLYLMRQAGVYRQQTLARLGFWGMVCLGRI